jgi:3-oxoacyl-[acyl-carrier protein] reductase
MLSSCTIGTPPKYLSNYTLVKYSLLGLMKSAAVEYGDKGININGISPGMIETKFLDRIGRKIREIAAEENPKHRNLKPEDLFSAIDYLFSDGSIFENGINLNLSGGLFV